MALNRLIWDGDCGFCQASVEWLMRRPGASALYEPVMRQRCPRPPMTDALFTRSGYEVVLLTADGRELGGADAIFELVRKTGGTWWASLFSIPPFIYLARWGYRLIATNRGWISRRFFGGKSCAIPSPASKPDPK